MRQRFWHQSGWFQIPSISLFWTLHLGEVASCLFRRHHIILVIIGWKAACIILPKMIPLSFSICANPICVYRKIILLYISKWNEAQTSQPTKQSLWYREGWMVKFDAIILSHNRSSDVTFLLILGKAFKYVWFFSDTCCLQILKVFF